MPQILSSVDVCRVTHPVAWHLDDQLGVPAQNRSRPLVPGQLCLEQRPYLPREQNGVAPLPPVGGDRDPRPLRKSIDEPTYGPSRDERLVPEQDHRGISSARPQPGEDRRRLAPLPLFVFYDSDPVPLADLAQPLRLSADDDDDLID